MSLALMGMQHAAWEFRQKNPQVFLEFGIHGLMSLASLLCMAIMDEAIKMAEDEDIDQEDFEKMMLKCNQDICRLIKVYSNIDIEELYNQAEALDDSNQSY